MDTPRHLAALVGDDQHAASEALEHLEIAVLHQGFAFPATAPVVRVVGAYLEDEAVEAGVRDRLLEFLGWAAEAAVHIEHSEYSRELLPGLHNAIVATYDSVYGYVEAENPDLRMVATAAAVSYARCAPLGHRRPALCVLLRRRIAGGERRAWHVAQLKAVGGRVADYLDDPDFDVRVTAALAPELADDATAVEVLVAGLERAAADTTSASVPRAPAGDPLLEYANSLVDPDPWRGYSLAELIAASIARVGDFQRIAEPAAQLVRAASWTGADRIWGPLVRAAFQPGYRADVPLIRVQRLMLGALVDNPQLWTPNDGNAALVFRQAGLPRDRDRCRQILDATR